MTAQAIHEQASVDRGAKLAPSVTIGAYAVIGEDVQLGEGCVVHPHAVITGPPVAGRKNVFPPFPSSGADPQDLKLAGEQTRLISGDENPFRENVAVSRGTVGGGGVTPIGN